MSTTNTPAEPINARQALIVAAGIPWTRSRADLVAAAGHVLAAQKLITWDADETIDLAMDRLIDMLDCAISRKPHRLRETLLELADELLAAAIEEEAI
jgi:hypothetical protein